jgi:hypothetical protein
MTTEHWHFMLFNYNGYFRVIACKIKNLSPGNYNTASGSIRNNCELYRRGHYLHGNFASKIPIDFKDGDEEWPESSSESIGGRNPQLEFNKKKNLLSYVRPAGGKKEPDPGQGKWV